VAGRVLRSVTSGRQHLEDGSRVADGPVMIDGMAEAPERRR
jgi:hypothetical protein